MKNLFNTDSKVYQWLLKFANVFLIGICCFLLCLPVITAGAAVTAMYRMMLNMRQQKPATVALFFPAFGQDFGKSTLLWLCDLGALGLLFAIFWILLHSALSDIGLLLCGIPLIFLFLAWAYTFLYVFPLHASFRNSVGNTLKSALSLAVNNRKQTVICLGFSVLPIFIYFLLEEYFFVYFPFWVLILIPLIFYWQSKFFQQVFEPYLPEEDTEEQLPEREKA